MSAILDKIIEEVKRLPVDELQQLRTMVDSLLLGEDETVVEDALECELIAEGILNKPDDRSSKQSISTTERRSFKPVSVTGKPVSEIIIEERR